MCSTRHGRHELSGSVPVGLPLSVAKRAQGIAAGPFGRANGPGPRVSICPQPWVFGGQDALM